MTVTGISKRENFHTNTVYASLKIVIGSRDDMLATILECLPDETLTRLLEEISDDKLCEFLEAIAEK